jgi:hypothetical protein
VGNTAPGCADHPCADDAPAGVSAATHHPGSLTTPCAESLRITHPERTNPRQFPTGPRTAAVSTRRSSFASTSAHENHGGPSCHTRASTVAVSEPGIAARTAASASDRLGPPPHPPSTTAAASAAT